MWGHAVGAGPRLFYLYENEPIDCGPVENYTNWPVNFERHHFFIAEIQMVAVEV